MTPPPAWLDADAAASFLSLRLPAFLRRVKDGALPAPSYHLGQRSPRWQRDALDAIMLGAATTHTQEVANAAAAILKEGRARRAANVGRRHTGRVSVSPMDGAESRRTVSG